MTKTGHAVIPILLLALARLAAGQDVAAARGPAFYSAFSLPDVSGTVRFSASLSDRFILGYNASNQNSNFPSISGSAAYLSRSPSNPFSVVYSGAFSHSTGGQPSQIVSNLALSQVLAFQKWHFTIADSINYLPETATSGLSGVPGLGDANVTPVTTGSDEIQGILTNQAQRITNNISGTTSRSLTRSLSLSVTGSQSLVRYLNVPGGSSTDSNSFVLSSGLQKRLDTKTSVGVQYSYANYMTSGRSFGTVSQSATVHASRTLTRRASVSGSVGPQRSSSTDSVAIPARTSFSSSAALSYNSPFAALSLNYSHGTTNAGGLTAGAQTTSLGLSASRQFEQALNLSTHIAYAQSSSLSVGQLETKALVFGVQANRSIMRSLSAYATYSASHQLSSGSAVSPLVLNGLSQTLGFGVTYSSRAFSVGTR